MMTINSDMAITMITVTYDPIIAVAWFDDDSVDSLTDELLPLTVVVSAALGYAHHNCTC